MEKMIEVLEKPKGRPRISAEVKELVVNLYQTNMTCGEIAKKCNISRASVFRIIRERRSEE